MTKEKETPKKTHWRKNFDYRFISGEEVQEPITLEIKEIVHDKAGKRDEDVVVVKFVNAKKGMVLNKTNARAIAKVVGSPYIEDWPGKKITITGTQVQAFGETVEAVRVVTDLPNITV